MKNNKELNIIQWNACFAKSNKNSLMEILIEFAIDIALLSKHDSNLEGNILFRDTHK